MELSKIITQMAILFLIMLIGFISNRKGILDSEHTKFFSRLVLTVGMPGTIIASVANGSPFGSRAQLLADLAVVAVIHLLLPLFAALVVKLLGFRADQRLYQFMMIFPNVGFMGFPVITALFGQEALAYAALFSLPHNFLMFSYGIHLVSGGGFREMRPKDALNPCILASIVSIVICILNVKLPEVLAQTCSYLGGMVTPAGMLIIGSSLAGVSLKELRCEWRLVPFLLLKLIGLPVVFYFVCAPFVADKMLVMVAATILAMPCATNAVLFSNTYGGNVRVSSKVVFLATLCSLITIPLVGGLLF